MSKIILARSRTFSAQSQKPKKESLFSNENVVNSHSLLLWALRIQFYNPTPAASPLTLANCNSAEVRWILAQSQNINTKFLFVFATSFYFRKLTRDGRIIFQQTRRILVQQNSEIVQSFFSSRKFHFLKNSRGQEEALLITMLLVFRLKLSFSGSHSLLQNSIILSFFSFSSCWTSLHLEYSFNNPVNYFFTKTQEIFAGIQTLNINLFFSSRKLFHRSFFSLHLESILTTLQNCLTESRKCVRSESEQIYTKSFLSSRQIYIVENLLATIDWSFDKSANFLSAKLRKLSKNCFLSKKSFSSKSIPGQQVFIFDNTADFFVTISMFMAQSPINKKLSFLQKIHLLPSWPSGQKIQFWDSWQFFLTKTRKKTLQKKETKHENIFLFTGNSFFAFFSATRRIQN